jgi:hypothetical protein
LTEKEVFDMVTGANKLKVVLDVDTHLEIHVGVIVNHLGPVLGTLSIPTTAQGYQQLEECVAGCIELHLEGQSQPTVGLYLTLRLLAKRWRHLSEELKQLDTALERLVKATAPQLVEKFGVSPHTAATLPVTAGDNPERLPNEGTFAALCGVSPLEASSGKLVRHRLNRGGNRQANNALWTIAMVRMRSPIKTPKQWSNSRRSCFPKDSISSTKLVISRCLKLPSLSNFDCSNVQA